MPIINTDLLFFKSSVISDTSANGGRMDPENEITTSVRNNILPNTTQAERDAGITRYRKIFAGNRNASNLAVQYPYIHMLLNTPGDDSVFLVLGDWRDIQSAIDITTNVDWRGGVGDLNTALSIGDTSVIVDFEDDDPRIWPNTTEAAVGNRKLWIGEGTTEELVEWSSFSASGSTVTYTLSVGVVNDYTTAAKVANVYTTTDDLEPTVESWVETAADTGTYDETTYPLTFDNQGTIDDDWTITFTSGTAFTVEGVFTGSVGTGNTSTELSPNNPDTSAPYFTLDATGWAGTWAIGDTIEFTTRPAAIPLWVVQDVPINTPSYSSNEFQMRFGGESA